MILTFSVLSWQMIKGLPSRRLVRKLSHYEIAYLAGGRTRVADTVIAEFVDRGALRIDSRGRLTEADASALVGPFASSVGSIPLPGMQTHGVRDRVKRDPEMKTMAARLRGDGLVIGAWPIAVVRWLVAAMLAALLVTGVARLMEGRSNHRPVSDLEVMLVVSVFLGFWLLRTVFNASQTTRHGRWYLRQQRKSHVLSTQLSSVAAGGTPFPRHGGSTLATAAVLGVALWGFRAVPDEGIRRALMAGIPGSTTGSVCGGGSCGGGSSCGGGGGGGCGG